LAKSPGTYFFANSHIFLKIQPLVSLAIHLQELRDDKSPTGGAPMPRALVTNDWRKLSKAASKERSPKKFVYLLKQLYDVVNEGEEKHSVSNGAKLRRAKRARVQRELEAV
jgi:hypothetical protein